MKIKSEENVYIIPDLNGACAISSSYVDDIVQCLFSYFVAKKKNKCVVIDEDGDLMKNDSVSFIYIPKDDDLTPLFNLKPKTLINSEIVSFIGTNQEMFKSIEMIRNGLIEMLTDQGMIKIRKIMQKHIENNINFIIDDFDLSRILQSISIEGEELTTQQKYMSLYNLLLYLSKDSYCVVYIDFEIDETTLKWIKLNKQDNILFLINNEAISTNVNDEIDYFLIESNQDFLERIEIDSKQKNSILYCFHPYVLKNFEFQTEKNKQIMLDFQDKNTSFLIKFATSTF